MILDYKSGTCSIPPVAGDMVMTSHMACLTSQFLVPVFARQGRRHNVYPVVGFSFHLCLAVMYMAMAIVGVLWLSLLWGSCRCHCYGGPVAGTFIGYGGWH